MAEDALPQPRTVARLIAPGSSRRFPAPGKLVLALLLERESRLADTGTAEEPVYHVGDPEELPVDLASRLPYAWVQQGPGNRDDISDSTFVDVEFFADADTDDAYEMAEAAADEHITRRSSVAGYGVIDTVRVSIRPQSVPWGDRTVSRCLVQFQLSTRRSGG